jgi:cytidylate kinase
VALSLLDGGVPLTDAAAATRVAHSLDTARLDDARLKGREMGEAASVVSAYQPVRDALLDLQRRFAAQPGGAVLDGRDIGTVICPDADAKLFVTASAEERARRRHLELASRNEATAYEAILADIRRRDERDMSRSTAPLKAAPDAVVLDTTELDADGAFAAALAIVEAAARTLHKTLT